MNLRKNDNLRPLIAYAPVTVFCLTFGLVYEYFGFGVTSPFMHFAFLVPLVLGVLPRLVLIVCNANVWFSDPGLAFWRLGIATFIIGAFFRGALDIYGTTSGLTTVYPVAGGMLLAAGAVLLTYSGLCYNKRNHSYHENGRS